MRMDKIVKLRTLTTTSDSGGFPSKSVSTVEVYADTKSVRQSEYYAADAKGKRLELVLVINADDWNGATEAELNGVVYTIERAYQKGLVRVELTCARR